MTELGAQEWQSAWRIKAVITLQEAIDLKNDILSFVDMKKDGKPDVRKYPNGDGNGGNGFQLYQPIVESWFIIGTWPEHGFIRINLSSCKFFEHGSLTSMLAKKFGAENILINWQMPL